MEVSPSAGLGGGFLLDSEQDMDLYRTRRARQTHRTHQKHRKHRTPISPVLCVCVFSPPFFSFFFIFCVYIKGECRPRVGIALPHPLLREFAIAITHQKHWTGPGGYILSMQLGIQSKHLDQTMPSPRKRCRARTDKSKCVL